MKKLLLIAATFCYAVFFQSYTTQDTSSHSSGKKDCSSSKKCLKKKCGDYKNK